MQDPGTRILRGVELQDHPLGIRNSRVRYRVQLPDVVVRQLEVHGADVVFRLLRLPGGEDHTGATLKIYPGLPHGMCSTHKDLINADLLAFIQGKDVKSSHQAPVEVPA